jgi:hypothetical protein
MRWIPKDSHTYNYYGLKPHVVYRCVRNSRGGYQGPTKIKETDFWALTGFEQISNVDVLTMIYTGKIIPEDLP